MADEHTPSHPYDPNCEVRQLSVGPQRMEPAHSPSPAVAPAAPRKRRPVFLYTIIGLLTAVVLVQGAYIAYLRSGVGQSLQQLTNNQDLTPLLQELGKMDLNSLNSLGDLGALNNPGTTGQAPVTGENDSPIAGQNLLDPNSQVTVEQLLGMLQQLQGNYNDALKMLDDPQYRVETPPPAQPGNTTPPGPAS